MALNIKDPETDRLARELAQATGESITEATRVAIAERLARVRGLLLVRPVESCWFPAALQGARLPENRRP